MATIAGSLLLAPQVGAQALGGQYQAYTSVQRGGVNPGWSISSDSVASAPIYSPQITGLGSLAIASADDTNGGTVSAYTAMVYDSRFDSPHTPPSYIEYVGATARSWYNFSLVGPSSDTWVPVLLRASGQASAGGYSYFTYNDPYGNYYGDAHDSFGASTNPTGFLNVGSFDVDRLLYLKTGRVYELHLDAEASRYLEDVSTNAPVSEASAWVDPTLTIQGDFSRDYQLVGLPASAIGGVTAAVPEPETWALMAGGFGMLGGVLRRRARAQDRCQA